MRYLIASIFLCFSLCLYSQNEYIVNICNKTSNSFSQKELFDCPQLYNENKNWQVESFEMLILIDNTSVIDIQNTGNELNSEMIALIKKYNPNKIFIEKIILINNKGESVRAGSLVIEIK